MRIELIDYIMGVGKSSYILREMESWYNKGVYEQFVYISPILSEVGGKRKDKGKGYNRGRVQDKCPSLDFRFPVNQGSSKVDNFRGLLLGGHNISATHSVFTNLSPLDIDLIKEKKNVLVIDEEVQALDTYTDLGKNHFNVLLTGGQVYITEDGKVCWNHKEFPQAEDFLNNPEEGDYSSNDKKLSRFINLCDGGYLHKVNDKVIIWEYPISILEAFDKVIVMTYMFDSSPMASWCKINNVEVETLLIPELEDKQVEVKESLKSLIEIVETKKMVEVERFGYSYSWWNGTGKNKAYTDKVKGVLENIFRNNLKGYSYKDCIFTCPENSFNKIKGKGYSRAEWLYSDCKATNDYADKKAMFYLYSKFPNVFIGPFCKEKGADIDPDKYALSSMLQWLFRGCCRKGEPMKVIILSKRMRDLLKNWLEEK